MMKKRILYFLLVLIAVIFSGCQQGPASDGEDPGTEFDPGIDAEITGTWIRTWSYTMYESFSSGEDDIEYECEETAIRTITASGDYIETARVEETTVEDPISTTVLYEAVKGKLTVSSGGLATWKVTHQAESPDVFGMPDTINWEEVSVTRTGNIAKIGEKLYLDMQFRRAGAGTGLVGTWIAEQTVVSGPYAQYTKSTIIFTETTMDFSLEVSADGTTYTPSRPPFVFTYNTNPDGSLYLTNDESQGKMYFLLTQDWFVLLSGTGEDTEGWTRI